MFIFVEKNIKETLKKTKELFLSSRNPLQVFQQSNLNYLYRNEYCYVKEVGIVTPLSYA